MTPEFYASLRLIILRDIADLRRTRGESWSLGATMRYGDVIRMRQRDLARLRALRTGTATEL